MAINLESITGLEMDGHGISREVHDHGQDHGQGFALGVNHLHPIITLVKYLKSLLFKLWQVIHPVSRTARPLPRVGL